MAITTRAEVVKDKPDGGFLILAHKGEEVEVLETKDDLVHVAFPQRPPGTKGWLPKDAVGDGTADVEEIKRDDFAQEIAFQQGRVLVQGHYLAAIAQLRSKITDGKFGEELGVFRVLLDEWKADWGNKSFDVNLPADPVNNVHAQASHFALMARQAQTGVTRFESATYIDLYLGQLIGVAAYKVLRETAGMTVGRALDTVGTTELPGGKCTPAQLLERHKALLQKDAKFADALKAIEGPLDLALKDTAPLFPQPQTKDVKVIDKANSELMSAVANVSKVTKNSDMAKLIVESFARAGYNQIQQIAALANAIEESGLNPTIKAAGDEQSFGLFQINLKGVGIGQNPEDLKDPQFNTDLIIKEANKTGLRNAATLEEAVRIFVKQIERPAHQEAAIAKRLATAQALMQA
jgi:hypothetical protein